MTTLNELIKTHALEAATASDWKMVAETLNTASVTITDSQAWTYAKIGQTLGRAVQKAARDFLGPIAAANPGSELADAHGLLVYGDGNLTGLRLDTNDVQDQFDAFIAAEPDNPQADFLLTALKQLGRRVESSAVVAGLGIVTAEQCAADWEAALLAERVQGWKERFDAALNTLGTSEAADGVAAVLTIAKQMESA